MDLFEYQTRKLYEHYQIPVLPSAVITEPEQALQVAEELIAQSSLLVVKAQVKTGGRGKAGGVKLARSPQEAWQHAKNILGMDIKGHKVEKVLIAAGADIAEEWYFSLLIDRSNRQYLSMFSRQGGVEIETLAKENPNALTKIPIDPLIGITEQLAYQLIGPSGFSPTVAEQVVGMIIRLWEFFKSEDALLVEVNPMVITPDGTVIALDGKVTLDDNAAFRHPEHEEFLDMNVQNPLEIKAKKKGINYVKIDNGQVGVIGNGAGIVMSTLDVVAYAGQDYQIGPANFLDIGGGASAEVMADALKIVLGDPDVKSVFVNVFGGITACDQVARGIVEAIESLGDRVTKPLVVRLDGNRVEEGKDILKTANHHLIFIEHAMDDAAKKAALLAARSIQ